MRAITYDEGQVLGLLDEMYAAYRALPDDETVDNVRGSDDCTQFQTHYHAMQNAILARVARRILKGED